MQAQRLPPGIVERPRLLTRLADARQATCVLIQGPAGSGKTILALQWRAELIPHGHDCAWCMTGAGDDAGHLLENLYASLDRVDPAIARECAALYAPGDGIVNADHIAIALLNGLARHPRPLVLFIDDYHHVTDRWMHAIVQTLLDFAPPHLRLAIVSRTAPPLALARVRDAGALVELHFSDLRFTFSETHALLRARDPGVARRDVRLLYDQTGGWGAGLRLAALHPQPGGGAALRRTPLQHADDFEAYFDREILARMPAAERDAIARMSAPHRFSDALAAELLGMEAGMALMDQLRRDNVFLLPAESGTRELWWRFHPLFRDVMQQRFRLFTQAEQRDTHARLGRWFGQRKLLPEAVRHCVAAGQPEVAADWVECHARSMFVVGEMRPLVRAVAMLPLALMDTRGSLRLWVAWAQLCYRQLDDCRASIALLAAGTLRDDGDARSQRTLLEGCLAIQSEDTDAGERLVTALAQLPAGPDAMLAGGRRNILGWLHIHQGRFEAARSLLDQPPLLLGDGTPLLNSAFGALQSRCMLGYAHLREGDLRQAEDILHDVLNTSDRSIGMFSEPACNAASFLAAVWYEGNQLDRLHTVLEPRFNVIERVALPEALVCAALPRIRLSALEGNQEEALSELDRLEEQIGRRQLVRARGYVLAERARMLLRIDRRDAAAHSLTQLEALAEGQPTPHAATGRELLGLALSTRAYALKSSGDAERALSILQGLALSGTYAGQTRRSVQLEAGIALLLEQLGFSDQACRRMEGILSAARKSSLVRSLLDLGTAVLDLGDVAHRTGLLTPGSSFYLEHLKVQNALAGRRTPTATTLARPDAPSERERDILQTLALTMSNKRVAQTLAISPETVKWHLKNIYAKLGVYGRDDAVAKARALGWLQGPGEGSSMQRYSQEGLVL
ncbi:LuxR C-terminal-related transcriptional regulator [Pseudorhodoferax sp. LjRoot39]|uniref:LuxR C-terminal-related transcriptional regulator n=1 Tax=Pseudorhodoferax sp. LjRoot39 TaxID=3342328 RepID=UPI003ECFA121